MKQKAFINLPELTITIAVWVAAALCIAAFVLDLYDVEWSNYLDLAETSVMIVVWGLIINSLNKNHRIRPLLTVLLVLSLVLSLSTSISYLITEDSIIVYLYYVVWIATLVVIISSYSGLFRKYAMTELLCLLGIIILPIIMVVFDIDANPNDSLFKGILKYAVLPLLFLPYQALIDALQENEDEEESEEEE